MAIKVRWLLARLGLYRTQLLWSGAALQWAQAPICSSLRALNKFS